MSRCAAWSRKASNGIHLSSVFALIVTTTTIALPSHPSRPLSCGTSFRGTQHTDLQQQLFATHAPSRFSHIPPGAISAEQFATTHRLRWTFAT